MRDKKPRNRFAWKCAADLQRSWEVGLVLLGTLGLFLLYRETEFRITTHAPLEQLNLWLRIYSDLALLFYLFLLICVTLGASGLGEELAQRTVWLWLLRPRSRTSFLLCLEGIGAAALFLLLTVPVAFLAAARIFLGPSPDFFRSPILLFADVFLLGLSLFAASRLLTFFFQSPRLVILVVIGLAIGLEMLAHSSPPSIAKFIPSFGELTDPGLVIAQRARPYPNTQILVWAVLCLLCYIVELARFRKLDIRV